MANPSERHFRDTLCESRSYAVETTDPTGARTIDELRRQVKELRAVVEADKVKHRQLVRDHNKQLQHLREEEARRLDAALEACAIRKDQEKVNELKKLEEQLKKQKDLELRQLNKEKMDELNKSYRKWQADKNEAVRVAVETERRQSMEELQSSFAEEEAQSRVDKLTREVFILGEQNSTLEQQVRNLSRLNRAQIDQMRRMKQECDTKVEGVIRQHKTEASREMAQLRLAEQIIAEKDHEIHSLGYRADMAVMEKEALEEELVTARSFQNTSNSSVLDSSQHEMGTPSRRSTGGGGGGGGGMVQRRVEELEAQVKKLEEEKASLRQNNATLRKKAQGEVEKATVSKATEEKLKSARKKNSELSALAKDLDERIRALKAENEQLKAKTPSGDGEQNVHKALARRHAKDISEYTKQIHAKDRELTELRKKVAKLEEAAASHSEPSPELQKKVKAMNMEKLRMEKLMAKLYSRLPDVVNTEDFSHKDLVVDSGKLDQLMAENQALQERLQALKEAGPRDGGVDSSLPAQEREELLAEISRLKELTQSASELQSQCAALRETNAGLEAANSSLEQRCHELSQQLKISTLAVRELEGSQEVSVELEGRVEELRGRLSEREDRIADLERECQETSAQLSGKQAIIEVLQKQVESLEGSVKEKDQLNVQLRSALEESVQAATAAMQEQRPPVETTDRATQSPTPREIPDLMPPAADPPHKPIPAATRVQTDVSGGGSGGGGSGSSRRFPKERIRSPIRRSGGSGLRSLSPRTSSGDLLDSSLDNEMRAAGVEVNDSYDSSEGGVGFSDSNLDTSVIGSDHSMAREEAGLGGGGGGAGWDGIGAGRRPHPHRMAWEEDRHAVTTDQAQAMGAPEGRGEEHHHHHHQATLSNGVRSGGSGERAESGQLSPGASEGDMATSSQDRALDSDDSPTPQSDNYKVGVYIAKYTYNPSEMSPNQNFDLELPLTAGDYLYVYGDMDEDGYYHGQLMTGQSGMVPSNFIEKVSDDEDTDDVSQPARKLSHKSHSPHLQDIQEVDENTTSSGGVASIPPPQGLTLERQFVEGDHYSVAIQWEVPRPLPEGVTGYCVYVNGEFKDDVSGGDKTNVLLTGIPRKQLVQISVRTTAEEGESPDPAKLIVLNPQYPETPTNVRCSLSASPPCLSVHWTPSTPLKEGNPITGYTVHLNGHNCVQLGTNPKPAKSVCAQVLASDMRDCREKLLRAGVVTLTVCAVSGEYSSLPSLPVVVSKEDILAVCDSGRMTADESEITSSATSLSSSAGVEEEEREVYSPGGKQEEEEEGEGGGGRREVVSPQEVGVVTVEDVAVSNGVSVPPSNGTAHEGNGHAGTVTYYRALVSYNPQLQSPNEDAVDEELAFHENDIIIGLEPVDEDGFILAELNGSSGFIPGNLVEELTDPEELLNVPALLRAQRSGVRTDRGVNGTDGGEEEGEGEEEGSVHKMRALYDYDPAQDSPNANSEVELALTEGELVTVFGKSDADGFFKAELKGKKGLVPSNFLAELTPPRNDGIEVFAADEDSMRIADQIIQKTVKTSENSSPQEKTSKRSKGSLFSRGKNLLTKGKGNK